MEMSLGGFGGRRLEKGRPSFRNVCSRRGRALSACALWAGPGRRGRAQVVFAQPPCDA
jgi:hypothetical protein